MCVAVLFTVSKGLGTIATQGAAEPQKMLSWPHQEGGLYGGSASQCSSKPHQDPFPYVVMGKLRLPHQEPRELDMRRGGRAGMSLTLGRFLSVPSVTVTSLCKSWGSMGRAAGSQYDVPEGRYQVESVCNSLCR